MICGVFFLPTSDPQLFTGHTSNIKKVMFLPGGDLFLSCSDDRSLRVWDRRTGQVGKQNYH